MSNIEGQLRGETRQSLAKLKRRRTLGIYYTPAALTDAIAYWAVRNGKDTILEPSFGGCAFLAAARQRLLTLKVKRPGNQLAGCDIDQSAFTILHSIAGKQPSPLRYLKRDFLSVEPSNFPIAEFTCVLGNPPFVRHNEISKSVKRSISRLASRTADSLPKTAGLWAHFVSHSQHFLAENGRLGLVLPGSFLFADYARPLRESLRRNFSRTTIVKLNYRTFFDEGADERAVVLLAEGFGTSSIDWVETTAASELTAIATIKAARAPQRKSPRPGNGREDLNSLYHGLVSEPFVKAFGEIAKVDIGVVTGDNKFFILSKATAQRERLRDSLFTPMIARAGHASGLMLQAHDFVALKDSQAPCLLLTPKIIRRRDTYLRRYLATMSSEQRNSAVWLNKRARWYCPDVGQFPNAVLTYMNHQGPRLILLDGTVTCSNTLHRIWLPGLDATQQKLIALSLLTTFSQLSAEIEGRSYGGGVLKLEPSDARRLKVIVRSEISKENAEQAFTLADSFLRVGQHERASEIADQLVFRPLLGNQFQKAILELKKQLCEKRYERHTRRVIREKQACQSC